MVDRSMHSGTKDGVFSSKIWYRDWIIWGQEPGQLWFLKIQLMLCSSPWEEFILSLPYCSSGLPNWCSGKEPAWQSRRCRKHEFHPWVGKSSWSRKWQHTPVFLPGKFHEQRSLAGYGHKESDMTELTHTLLLPRDRCYFPEMPQNVLWLPPVCPPAPSSQSAWGPWESDCPKMDCYFWLDLRFLQLNIDLLNILQFFFPLKTEKGGVPPRMTYLLGNGEQPVSRYNWKS